MNRNKEGFTILEILIIVAIIGILVSVVLISLMGGKNNAQDNSAFTSFKSLAAPAYMCMMGGGNLTLPVANNSICNPSGIVPNSNWPEFTRTGWAYAGGGFFWCNPLYNGGTPPTSCGVYNNGSCGGNNDVGYFCFGMTKDGKTIWCTTEGCRKTGF